MQRQHVAITLLALGIVLASMGAGAIEPGFGGILGGLMTFVVGIFLAMGD